MEKKYPFYCDLEDYKIVTSILKKFHEKYGVRFFAFGSRVLGTQKPFSDLDLCYLTPLPLPIVVELEEELHDSDLPFKVDLIDYTHCSKAFQEKIKSQLMPL